jgi:hypothetical protein
VSQRKPRNMNKCKPAIRTVRCSEHRCAWLLDFDLPGQVSFAVAHDHGSNRLSSRWQTCVCERQTLFMRARAGRLLHNFVL